MREHAIAPFILVADDDPDDCLMIREAFEERCRECQLCFVHDGEELMRFLRGEHDQHPTGSRAEELPDLILLDLNMPLMDGRQALQEIKSDPRLRRVPTVILTTSGDEADIAGCYRNGANSYIIKPTRYSELIELAEALKNYWVDTVALPRKVDHHGY